MLQAAPLRTQCKRQHAVMLKIKMSGSGSNVSCCCDAPRVCKKPLKVGAILQISSQLMQHPLHNRVFPNVSNQWTAVIELFHNIPTLLLPLSSWELVVCKKKEWCWWSMLMLPLWCWQHRHSGNTRQLTTSRQFTVFVGYWPLSDKKPSWACKSCGATLKDKSLKAWKHRARGMIII